MFGVLTIVTTAAVYLTWIAAAMVASPVPAMLVGASFGLARSVPMFASASLVTPSAIARRVGRLAVWNGTFGTMTVLAEIATAGAAALAVLS